MPKIGQKDYSVEFNDSTFETKGWKGSRYEGKQLQGNALNVFEKGDVTFGTTPVISNVSRNIYIGNSVVSLSEDTITDDTLVPFPSSSYVLIDKYITINDDMTIADNTYDGSNLDSKKGFYRAFYDDFPIGGNFSLKILDDSVDNFLADNYQTYFNQGRLHKVGQFLNSSSYNRVDASKTGVSTISDTITIVNLDWDGYGPYFKVFNNQYTSTFYNDFGIKTNAGEAKLFFEAAVSDMQISTENRYFFTFSTGSELAQNTPVIAATGSSAPVRIGTYATCEWFNFKEVGVLDYINGMEKFSLVYPHYITLDPLNSYNPNGTITYGYYISKLNNSKPSILTKLHVREQLPSSTGDAPFVVIPSNLHPFLKDNLLYFLGQAGINIGSQNIPNVISNQNRKLK